MQQWLQRCARFVQRCCSWNGGAGAAQRVIVKSGLSLPLGKPPGPCLRADVCWEASRACRRGKRLAVLGGAQAAGGRAAASRQMRLSSPEGP